MEYNKVEIMESVPVPKNCREVASFLGFCGFFSVLNQNGKAMLGPMLSLIRKDTPYKWGPLEDEMFIKVKETLKNARIGGFLKLANGKNLHEVIVFTDYCQSSKSVCATVYVKTYTDKSFEVTFFGENYSHPRSSKKALSNAKLRVSWPF